MKKKIIIGLILQLIGLLSYAQTATISGIIIDSKDNAPLIGTHIFT